MNKLFIGLVPPQEYQERHIKLQQQIEARVGVRTPNLIPHITIIPPFYCEDVDSICSGVDQLSDRWFAQNDLTVRTSALDWFRKRVLYVKTEPVSLLNDLHRFTKELRCLGYVRRSFQFSPHMTIVKDLIDEKDFYRLLNFIRQNEDLTAPVLNVDIQFDRLYVFSKQDDRWKIVNPHSVEV